MAWYVLIPGACHGGWWYEPVAERLRAAGHTVDAVTLPGLAPDGPTAPGANLDTHWLPHSPFPPTADRLDHTPGWTVTHFECRHNVLAEGPDTLMKPLLDVA